MQPDVLSTEGCQFPLSPPKDLERQIMSTITLPTELRASDPTVHPASELPQSDASTDGFEGFNQARPWPGIEAEAIAWYRSQQSDVLDADMAPDTPVAIPGPLNGEFTAVPLENQSEIDASKVHIANHDTAEVGVSS